MSPPGTVTHPCGAEPSEVTTSLKESPQAQHHKPPPAPASEVPLSRSQQRERHPENTGSYSNLCFYHCVVQSLAPACLYAHAHHPQHSLPKSLPIRYIHHQVCIPTKAPDSPPGYSAPPSTPDSLQTSSGRLHPSMNLNRAFPGTQLRTG